MADNRAETAVEYKHRGNNCCQAVLLAFAEETGLDADTLRGLGAAYGCGMGAFDATCGALCGAQTVLGLTKYAGRPLLGEAKALHGEFKALCGSTDCGDLKGIKGGRMLCACDDCIRNAVKIMEKRL